jgi:uncharacterized protein YwgA
MNITVDIPWKRYALIAEMAKRLDSASMNFGKTALQKLVFFLQEIYRVDCGYDFELYTYGPYDSQLVSDLVLIEHWGCVSVTRVNDMLGGYQIRPTEAVDSIRGKAAGFLNDAKTKQALDDLVLTYGSMTARDLELRATTVYVARNFLRKGETATIEKVCRLVTELKPKFTADEIKQAVIELSERQHIQITA